MQFHQPNGALAATWILGAGLIGLFGNVTSIGGATTILGFGLVPPMLLMLRWSQPIHAVVPRRTPNLLLRVVQGRRARRGR